MKFVSNFFKFTELNQVIQLILLSLVSGFVFSLRRLEISLAIGLIAPLITATFLSLVFKDKRENEGMRTILTSLLISLGMIILIKNWNIYFYGIVNSLSVMVYYFSKKFSRSIDYNPINLAVILGLIFFPLTSFHILIGTFSFSTPNLVITAGIALFFLIKSQRLPIAVAYLAVVSCWGLIDWLIFNNSFLYWFSAELGFSGIIFMSLILINSNLLKDIKSMLLFGASVAFLKIVFKSHEFFYPAHLSLFTVSTLFNIWILGKGYSASCKASLDSNKI